MGIIRFLLAVAVIIDHTGPILGFTLIEGNIAVETFYIISGFYITLILNEKYIEKGSYTVFITNRALRLFPIYWIILIMTFISSYIFDWNTGNSLGNTASFTEYGHQLNITSYIFLIISNIIIFFQDVVMFLGIDQQTGNLHFLENYRLSHPEVFKFMLLPQAWTIAVELSFYLLAPLLLRRKLPFIVVILVISLAAKTFFLSNGLNKDPWTYRFFPFELYFFLCGAVSYHVYLRLKDDNYLYRSIHKIGIVLIIIFTLLFDSITFSGKHLIYFFLVTLSIPFIFKYTKDMKFDRLIGDLSYPMYINHFLILNIVFTVIPISIKGRSIMVIAASIIFGYVLNKYIGDKIEKFRQQRIIALKTKTD